MLCSRSSSLSLSRPLKRRRCLSTVPRYRILFFGADHFSCFTLKALYRARNDLIQHLVVVTPPDQKTGRRLKQVHRPPLRLLAESLSIPSIALPPTTPLLLDDWQPPSEFIGSPSRPRRDSLLITASFGHLIPTDLLSKFLPLNTLNLHPSLLPKYRGAAPIQWGIINGDADRNWHDDSETGMGVTVQELSRGKFDRGRILGQERIVVPERSDFSTLEKILAERGGELLVKILRDLETHQENAKPQDSKEASLAPKLTKQTSRIDWAKMTNVDVTRLQRGVGHQHPLWTTISPSSSSSPSLSTSSASSTLPPPRLQLQLILSPEPLKLDRSTLPLPFPLPLVPSSSLVESPPSPSPKRRNGGLIFCNPFDKHVYVTTTTNPNPPAPSSSSSSSSASSSSSSSPSIPSSSLSSSSSSSSSGPEFVEEDKVEVVRVEKVKREGGKWIEARDWWNGFKRNKRGGGGGGGGGGESAGVVVELE